MSEDTYTVLVEAAEEGGFTATCPALPGLVTEGDTMEEARMMAQDAIRAYLESLHKDHLPIPQDQPPGPGRGFLKHKVHLYPGWDSVEEDKKIEDDFEPFDADFR